MCVHYYWCFESLQLVLYTVNNQYRELFENNNINKKLTILLVRSGRLAIGGGGGSSSTSELTACTGLWYDCGAPSASVGVVLLGLELDTRLNEEPLMKKVFEIKFHFHVEIYKFTGMSSSSCLCHIFSIWWFFRTTIVPIKDI